MELPALVRLALEGAEALSWVGPAARDAAEAAEQFLHDAADEPDIAERLSFSQALSAEAELVEEFCADISAAAFRLRFEVEAGPPWQPRRHLRPRVPGRGPPTSLDTSASTSAAASGDEAAPVGRTERGPALARPSQAPRRRAGAPAPQQPRSPTRSPRLRHRRVCRGMLAGLAPADLARRLVAQLRRGPTARRGQWRSVEFVAARGGVGPDAVVLAVSHAGGRLRLRVASGRREVSAT